MIPYSYHMVDMGGIDLAEANGTVVEGLYNRLAMGRNACGDLILYNWKFADIEIAPSVCATLDAGTAILINGLIQVTELDKVTVLGIDPPIEPTEPLVVSANGTYTAEPPISGFNPVTVDVNYVSSPLTVSANGTYTPEPPVSGFNPVVVDVASASKYEEVEPDYFGFSYGYQETNGLFYFGSNPIFTEFFAPVEEGSEYVLFLPSQVANLYRAAQYQGKTYEDFREYVEHSHSGRIGGGRMITPSSDLSGTDMERRFFFTGRGGEIVILTSNISNRNPKPILLKIQED